MAYIDKMRKKDKLEKDILKLIQTFYNETGYRVTNINTDKCKYQNSEGLELVYITKVEVDISPQV